LEKQETSIRTSDLTGCLSFLSKFYQESEPSTSEVKESIQLISLHLFLDISEPFEVVASACKITQLIDTVFRALGSNHSCLFDFILKVRIII
jgi:hypothetical protein